MPTTEARHERANRITVAAARIARRDGRTPSERARIYEREVERLMGQEPAYREPLQPSGFLFRF